MDLTFHTLTIYMTEKRNMGDNIDENSVFSYKPTKEELANGERK